MHMKRHLYQRLRSHRRKYLNIDMHKHHSRECHTHSRMHTYTQSIQLSGFFAPHDTKHNALVSTGNSTLRKQHVKATYTVAYFFAIVYLTGTRLICLPSETCVETNRCFETNISCNHTFLDTQICI